MERYGYVLVHILYMAAKMLICSYYSSSHNHGRGEWVPPRPTCSTIRPFSTSMSMGGGACFIFPKGSHRYTRKVGGMSFSKKKKHRYFAFVGSEKIHSIGS